MFADGFESVGILPNKSEKISAEISQLSASFKKAGKERDWRLVIQLLEDFPELNKTNYSEQLILQDILKDLRSLVEKRDKKGKVFSSESLTDLSGQIHDLLSLREGEIGL